MFCGECGRAVGTRTAQAVHPDSGMPLQATAENGAPRSGPQHRDTVILEPLGDSFPELSNELAGLHQQVDENATPEPASAAGPETPVPVDPGVEQDLAPEVVEEDLAEQAAPAEP